MATEPESVTTNRSHITQGKKSRFLPLDARLFRGARDRENTKENTCFSKYATRIRDLRQREVPESAAVAITGLSLLSLSFSLADTHTGTPVDTLFSCATTPRVGHQWPTEAARAHSALVGYQQGVATTCLLRSLVVLIPWRAGGV